MTIRFRAFSVIKMTEIRKILKEDISAVAEIERLCFDEPWSERALMLLLEEKNAGFVALIDGRIAAYVGLVTVLDEGQITNVATHPSFRRLGLARSVMNAIDEHCVEKGIVYLSLEVREGNEAARSLYSSLGWREAGIRKNFYSRPTDNAVVMIKELLKGN